MSNLLEIMDKKSCGKSEIYISCLLYTSDAADE